MSSGEKKALAEKIREYAAGIEYQAHQLFELATSLDGFRRIDVNDFEELEEGGEQVHE